MFDSTLLDIGREKQLFIDDLMVESAENVRRTWHHPVKTEESPVLLKDRPWEHITYFSCNTWQVIRDPRDNLFKCWYTDWEKPEVRAGDFAIGESRFNILYAESGDGLTWDKPVFDLYPVDGRSTNIVIPDAYNLGLVLDPHERDEGKRFKGIYTRFRPGGEDSSEVFASTSEDGIRWSATGERPVFGRSGAQLDDVVIIHYDPVSRIYVMNTRHYDMYAVARNLENPVVGGWCPPYYPLNWARMNKRRVFQTESADFIHWGEPYAVLSPEDGLDDLDECFYGLCQFPAGSVTIGFLGIYNYVSNTMRVRLVYSRNGKSWEHLNKRQPFLEPGPEGSWDRHMVTIPSKPVEVGDELYIYHGGSVNHHDWWITGSREGLEVPEATDLSRVGYALGLARLRLDGFASLDCGPVRRGILITRPFISDGTSLVVNARCREKGSIAAEIVDIRDRVVEGFSRDECDVFEGDSVRHTFSWKGIREIPAGSAVRAEYPKPEIERIRKIRFFMSHAELYSFIME
jgi:hypothetical protein